MRKMEIDQMKRREHGIVKRKSLLKSNLAFVMAIALVVGAVPIDGLVPVAKADGPDQGQHHLVLFLEAWPETCRSVCRS